MPATSYTNPGPKPMADVHQLHLDIEKRFLTPAERRARVEGALMMRGFTSLANLAVHMGSYPSVLYRTLEREAPPITMIMKLAVLLNVSLSYLMEKKVDGPQ